MGFVTFLKVRFRRLPMTPLQGGTLCAQCCCRVPCMSRTSPLLRVNLNKSPFSSLTGLRLSRNSRGVPRLTEPAHQNG